MAIYGQPNRWQCGPFALKHALLVQGVTAHEDVLAGLAGSSESCGTDEDQLARAAEAFGAELHVERYWTAGTARGALRVWLQAGTPVLLCVDQWDHWVAAVGADPTRVVLLDSHYDSVLRIESWDTVLGRAVYREPVIAGLGGLAWHWYDLQPVAVTALPVRTPHLTPEGAERLMRWRGGRLLGTWDEYLRILVSRGQPVEAVPHDDLAMVAECFGLPAPHPAVPQLTRPTRRRGRSLKQSA